MLRHPEWGELKILRDGRAIYTSRYNPPMRNEDQGIRVTATIFDGPVERTDVAEATVTHKRFVPPSYDSYDAEEAVAEEESDGYGGIRADFREWQRIPR